MALSLGLTLWNLSCLEFKFDDTRLSYWHKNKIGRIEKKFCCFLTLLIFCPVGWVSFAETSQQGKKLAKLGSNKKNFQFCQSYSYVNRKVWYHQIWIPNNLGFMVLILPYIFLRKGPLCLIIFYLIFVARHLEDDM